MLLIEEGPKKIKIKEKKGLFGPTEIREERYVIAKETSMDDNYRTSNYQLGDIIAYATGINRAHAMEAITHTLMAGTNIC
ncbi:MAG: hypothetical protein DRN03_04365 [Thermoplasmata archaeon]|nr:MAG: hypothetical protein DRN03_04365 [Thermoplasmata archaeon]